MHQQLRLSLNDHEDQTQQEERKDALQQQVQAFQSIDVSSILDESVSMDQSNDIVDLNKVIKVHPARKENNHFVYDIEGVDKKGLFKVTRRYKEFFALR